MSRTRAKNVTVSHPRKRDNSTKRSEEAMRMAKSIREKIGGMKVKSVDMEFMRSMVKERVTIHVAFAKDRKDFWRLVGEEAVKILMTGKDMVTG